ncbi:DUF3592 domain-containing protein [Aeromicrobium sp. 9AM]|uniref:DUF3592 domain-containing protein n=1 Tax=Aeromicrobium sp. 9AM TaxID=2653126 RepID=UPI0012F0077D|nr:exported hypothetical protein [Aeromicrobium sp. 9AM]
MRRSHRIAGCWGIPAALTCVSLALAVAAALSLVLAPDSTTTGKVVAMGWNGGGTCYPTARYTVAGETYRTTPHRSKRWCGYEWGGPATVYYDASSPSNARLAKYDDSPKWLAGTGLAVFLLALLFVRAERARRTLRTRSSERVNSEQH